MTLDDLGHGLDIDTWWVISGAFIGANFESDIHFAPNNDSEAQDS